MSALSYNLDLLKMRAKMFDLWTSLLARPKKSHQTKQIRDCLTRHVSKAFDISKTAKLKAFWSISSFAGCACQFWRFQKPTASLAGSNSMNHRNIFHKRTSPLLARHQHLILQTIEAGGLPSKASDLALL